MASCVKLFFPCLILTTTVLKHGILNAEAPCIPWNSVQHLLTETGSKIIIIFTNDSIGMPTKLLVELQLDLHRVVLMDCDNRNTMNIFRPFLKEIQGKCRELCTFLLLCNAAKIREIIHASLDYDMLRPWTLWVFGDPLAPSHIHIGNLIGTGVSIAVPVLVELPPINEDIEEEECPLYNAMKVFAYTGNKNIQELETFHAQPEHNKSDHKSVYLVGAHSGKGHHIMNLFNQTIRVGVKELPPFLERTGPDQKKYKGVCIKILEVFAKAMNFSYELIADNYVGSRIVNGTEITWDGLFGQLLRRDIDLALGALTVTEDRADIVEFTDHFAEDTSSIMTLKPGLRSRVLIFVRVFPWQVWLLLIFAIIVMGPSMTLLEHGFGAHSVTKTNVWVNWWSVLTTAMQQGEIAPTRIAARILAVFWLMFTVVLVGVYSGLLLAVMSFPGTENPVDSLSELVKTSLHATAVKFSATYNYIRTGDSVINMQIKKRWEQNPEQKFLTIPEDAIDLLDKGRYAILSERMIFHYLIAKQLSKCNCCSYHEAKGEFLKHYYSFAVPKNSAIIESLNIIIRRLHQMGILRQWLGESLPNIASCQESKPENVMKPMGLEDIQGAFYTLGIGIGLSVFILMGEFCINCMCKRSKIIKKRINP